MAPIFYGREPRWGHGNQPDGSAEVVNQEFRRGEGMALYRNVEWKLKRKKFFAHHTNQYYVLDGEKLLGIVPYISYSFSFPVMVPRWGGVLVVHPDGEIENLSPEEAIRDGRFEEEGSIELLARKVGDVWKYRNGYWNTWFAHKDEAQIPQIDAPENQNASLSNLLPSGNLDQPDALPYPHRGDLNGSRLPNPTAEVSPCIGASTPMPIAARSPTSNPTREAP